MRLTGRKSLGHYIQQAVGDMIETTLPAPTIMKISALEQEFGVAFARPPPLPFSTCFPRRSSQEVAVVPYRGILV